MAPTHQTDPCRPASIANENLAFGAPARASRSLPDQPPGLAVDEDTGAVWNSGGGPQQWIEIDLGAPMDIGRIVLTVSQYPDGPTVHQIWVRGPGHSLRLAYEFRGETRDSQALEFVPTPALAGVQFVRILTTASPSWVAWKEIEVYGPE
ncbi:MAG: discoidin domain-containing protein, partial [Anaerolineales bacterium]